MNTINLNLTPSGILRQAEDLLNTGTKISREEWISFLDVTSKPSFLQALADRDERYRWAEAAFRIIKQTDYSLRDMVESRVKEHPNRILFSVFNEGGMRIDYSYNWLREQIKKTAALLIKLKGKNVKTALFAENHLTGAVTDIACLSYGIFISPLNIHFSLEVLVYLFKKMEFNIAVSDSDARCGILKGVREKGGLDFQILYTGDGDAPEGTESFNKLLESMSKEEAETILAAVKGYKADEICTIMFTSGSTGMPKGVAFSNYNIVSKRFARGAALPDVGEDEVLLSYLPLFHTFGRYLELLGMIYWGGTYVFAGKNDIDNLTGLMKKVRPTGFISIPLRWKQLYEKMLEAKEKSGDSRIVTGGRLRWGLSAAGYLEPKIFKYFNKQNIALCSGFGMTEATGGICMTPPGEYKKDSVGIPLPGISVKFSEEGEMLLKGEYTAKYLEDIETGQVPEWLATGDLFRKDEDGYLYIIDRLKDIYKNIKGQTIAPAYIEKKFDDIPGLKRAFLAGDMKPYNTLLIYPDLEDPFIIKAKEQHKLDEYFSTITADVNKSLHTYERVVRFKIIERNFSEDKGELTAKGTFRRKVIEENFKHEIESLYKKSELRIKCGGVQLIIPLWVIKDIGIAENDLECKENGLYNKAAKIFLHIKAEESGRIRIGDFEYFIKLPYIDLGVFARQPILWIGNRSLINFIKCREDWEMDFKGISSQIIFSEFKSKDDTELKNTGHLSSKTVELNKTIIKLLYSDEEGVLTSLKILEDVLIFSEHKIENLISRRIEALARHPKFNVRSLAYTILLLNRPEIDYDRYLPAFIEAGLPFLNKKVIQDLGYNNIEGVKLDEFTLRLEAYRKGLKWPINAMHADQFKRILELLVYFVKNNPSSYPTVRAELVKWILHRQDPVLSEHAQKLFAETAAWYEKKITLTGYEKQKENWDKKIVYHDQINEEERSEIEKRINATTFLKEAFMIIYEEKAFNLKNVQNKGIYITKISAHFKRYLYRVSINMKNYLHYDILIFIKPGATKEKALETIYHMIKIGTGKGGDAILPKPGNFRSEEGIVSFEFINDLNLGERIRQITSIGPLSRNLQRSEWEILYRRGISRYFAFLKNSDYKVIPGNISPSNVVVPEPYFKKGAKILSIAGWEHYKKPSQIFTGIVNNFYEQVFAQYPWTRDFLKPEWMFDGCLEGLGETEGMAVLKKLMEEGTEIYPEKIKEYIHKRENIPFTDSYIVSAVKSYEEWKNENKDSAGEARLDYVKNLYSLYRMENFSELAKLMFYRDTYFSDADEDVKALGDKLVYSVFKYPYLSATKRIEIADIQQKLDDAGKEVIATIFFPKIKKKHLELMPAEEKKDLVLTTQIKDHYGKVYNIRPPLTPFELGSMNKLFILDNYPIRFSENLQHLIILDQSEDKIAGGISYKVIFPGRVQIEGIEVAMSYRKRGLGRLMIEDFIQRMRSEGNRTLSSYYLKGFFEKTGFKADSRWGGLVKFL